MTLISEGRALVKRISSANFRLVFTLMLRGFEVDLWLRKIYPSENDSYLLYLPASALQQHSMTTPELFTASRDRETVRCTHVQMLFSSYLEPNHVWENIAQMSLFCSSGDLM